MSALQRAVLNTGETTYLEVWQALYEQGVGVDVPEEEIRKAMRTLGLDTSQARR